jgi:hypothetical protein
MFGDVLPTIKDTRQEFAGDLRIAMKFMGIDAVSR